jgi:hypothetical protein
VDPEHSCEESVVMNMMKQFLHTQDGSAIRWNCKGCHHGYHSGTPRCNKTLCASIKGHSLVHVIDMTLAMIEVMLLSVTPLASTC